MGSPVCLSHLQTIGADCYFPPCNSFNGVYKPPWWFNPSQDGHGQLSAGIAAKHQIYLFSFYVFLSLPGLCAALKLAPGAGPLLDRPLPARLGVCACLRGATTSSCLLWASVLVLVGVWLWRAYTDYLQPVYSVPDSTAHDIAKGVPPRPTPQATARQIKEPLRARSRVRDDARVRPSCGASRRAASPHHFPAVSRVRTRNRAAGACAGGSPVPRRAAQRGG